MRAGIEICPSRMARVLERTVSKDLSVIGSNDSDGSNTGDTGIPARLAGTDNARGRCAVEPCVINSERFIDERLRSEKRSFMKFC